MRGRIFGNRGVTLGEHFIAQDRTTARVGKVFHMRVPGDPQRPFVTVSCEGDGSDQPDAKAAEKSVELLREFQETGRPFLLAVGFVRPHYPMVAPRHYFEPYPIKKMTQPHVPEGDLDDIPPAGTSVSNSQANGLAPIPGRPASLVERLLCQRDLHGRAARTPPRRTRAARPFRRCGPGPGRRKEERENQLTPP